jgi:CheY-like chemotaxis protein
MSRACRLGWQQGHHYMVYEVLLVDDDDPTRFVYREILHRMDMEVMEAADGLAAVDLLRHHTPNVIILDLLLPKKPGWEVLEYIYATPHLADTRVIIFTAHDAIPLKLRPGDVFLLKPLNPQVLREAVLRAVASPCPKH